MENKTVIPPSAPNYSEQSGNRSSVKIAATTIPAVVSTVIPTAIPARPMSVASGNQKQVKVLFDFDAENANELSSMRYRLLILHSSPW